MWNCIDIWHICLYSLKISDKLKNEVVQLAKLILNILSRRFYSSVVQTKMTWFGLPGWKVIFAWTIFCIINHTLKTSPLVLFFLYILQGVPLGLKSAVPLVLQERGVGLDDQSVFSVSNYPFSMKILWAPIVDSVFIKKFGRRKSWLIPTQTVIGDT